METKHPESKPTVRQVYALAAALCARTGEEFPATRAEASGLIERLRDENGDRRDAPRAAQVSPPLSPRTA